jgi:hypothetical protein
VCLVCISLLTDRYCCIVDGSDIGVSIAYNPVARASLSIHDGFRYMRRFETTQRQKARRYDVVSVVCVVSICDLVVDCVFLL